MIMGNGSHRWSVWDEMKMLLNHLDNNRMRLFSGLCFFVGVCLLHMQPLFAEEKPPNILFLFADDQPPGCLGCMGNNHNMLPLLRNEPVAWREHFYYQHTYQTNPPRSPIPHTEGIRTKDWKFVRFPDTQPVYEQLFDLQRDPQERHNLISENQYASRLGELRKLCDDAPAKLR